MNRRVITSEEMVEFFKGIDQQCLEIVERKNADYAHHADNPDVFGNLAASEIFGVASIESGLLVRVLDKIARLCRLSSGHVPKVDDEKLEDTILDSINYLKFFLLAKHASSWKKLELHDVDCRVIAGGKCSCTPVPVGKAPPQMAACSHLIRDYHEDTDSMRCTKCGDLLPMDVLHMGRR